MGDARTPTTTTPAAAQTPDRALAKARQEEPRHIRTSCTPCCVRTGDRRHSSWISQEAIPGVLRPTGPRGGP